MNLRHGSGPSAARSLEEGMDKTSAVRRLRVPAKLRTTSRSTNPIEPTFDILETVSRNVNRWHRGDHHLRWAATTLLWAQSQWNRIHGGRQLPVTRLASDIFRSTSAT